jgi:hypothetical protein
MSVLLDAPSGRLHVITMLKKIIYDPFEKWRCINQT